MKRKRKPDEPQQPIKAIVKLMTVHDPEGAVGLFAAILRAQRLEDEKTATAPKPKEKE